MYLTQNNSIKKSKIFKKKFFLIIFFFILVFFIFFLIIKPINQTKNVNKNTYEKIIKEINANKNANFFNAEKFIIENKNVYGTLISLSLSKKYILKNHLEEAFIQLKTSLKYTNEENLKNILRLRMSKIKIQQNKNKDAMQIIQEIQDDSWKSIVENIKGDIFMKNGNKKLAIKCWKKSKFLEESKTSKEIINMKINEAQIK
ncbi:YfgM family protein [Buchnera aphidicola]|uniref:Tetratricopeptide repeat protein n=1 Tax=Buchnera aphidicola (Aphis gossypii) TaxID=98785 RepID=A0A5J6Z913_9GAMM|nr:tetratricopeptide repeat protein [Buchnera aphidicola]QFQ31862.1 tetratricopeptide repeat protein [Buchnera aphidicola (Aphis gossypii)]UPT14394.1 tetratricopeptide repeat protein [Buchnera aphidicola (Aphis gossypii)]